MKQYRTAIIGCGQMGSQYIVAKDTFGVFTHADAYHTCDHTTLTGICDIDQNALNDCAKKWNVPNTYNSIQDLLEDGPWDIISLCTPDHTHAELTHLILDSKQAHSLFLEKPLALDQNSAAKVVEHARNANIPIQVNYSRRFDSKYRWLKNAISEGQLGEIRRVIMHYTGGIFHNGSHALDIIFYLFGEYTIRDAIQPYPQKTADPTIDAFCTLKNDIPYHLIGHPDGTYDIFEGEIWGSHGCVRLRDSGTRLIIEKIQPSKLAEGYQVMETVKVIDDAADSTLNAILEIIAQLENKSSPLSCTVDDAHYTVTTAESICARANS